LPPASLRSYPAPGDGIGADRAGGGSAGNLRRLARRPAGDLGDRDDLRGRPRHAILLRADLRSAPHRSPRLRRR